MTKLNLEDPKKSYGIDNIEHTHFGFQKVSSQEKTKKVSEVFDSVAWHYDLMNDLMSAGLHRFWKTCMVRQCGVQSGMKVLDIAGGTGDIALAFSKAIKSDGEVWLADINSSMLDIARTRLINSGFIIPIIACDAESLPFPSKYFNQVTLAFGLRNMTHKNIALKESVRVLKLGGKFTILEFSQVAKFLKPIYDLYSFQVLPWLGEKIANDSDSYRYLVESIRMHPKQEDLAKMMTKSGLSEVRYSNMTGGIVALHEGIKLF